MSTSDTKDIIGSWFPTGYYGHVRNRVRSDFVCEYRQLAKPQPPVKFVSRSMCRDQRHPFTLHDNRNTFKSDGIYFSQGSHGKRKNKERCPRFDPDFYTWMPLRQQLAQGLPHLSTYQTDYSSVRETVKQLLVANPPTSCMNQPPDTTYHYQYCVGCPHRAEMKVLTRDALKLSTVSREQDAIRNPPKKCETVASCLSWYRGDSQRLPAVAPNSGAEVAAESGRSSVCPPCSADSRAVRPDTQSSSPPSLQPASGLSEG